MLNNSYCDVFISENEFQFYVEFLFSLCDSRLALISMEMNSKRMGLFTYHYHLLNLI